MEGGRADRKGSLVLDVATAAAEDRALRPMGERTAGGKLDVRMRARQSRRWLAVGCQPGSGVSLDGCSEGLEDGVGLGWEADIYLS